jgi:hypothetical protein
MPYEPGDVIRVAFTGKITDSTGNLINATYAVKDPDGFTQYLYLDDFEARDDVLNRWPLSREPRDGERVTVSFTATIPRADAPKGTTETPPAGTTEVESKGYFHYLNLASSFITAVASKPDAEEPDSTGTETAPTREQAAALLAALTTDSPAMVATQALLDARRAAGSTSTVTATPPGYTTAASLPITNEDTEVTSTGVSARIGVLTAVSRYEVVRLRTGEVLFAGSSQEACRSFITDEDWNPERVVVRENLDEDTVAELGSLLALQESALARLGTRSWILREDDYFDASWARGLALPILGAGADLNAWPLSVIDWERAAFELRDASWTPVPFDGLSYYGQPA